MGTSTAAYTGTAQVNLTAPPLHAATALVHMAAAYLDDEALQYEFRRWCSVWQFTT